MRQPQKRNAAKAQTALSTSIPAPVGGWNQKDALSNMPPTDAVIMDNWIPRAGYCELRAGSGVQSNGLASPVHSLLAWRGPTTDKLFAGSGVYLYEVTTQGAAPTQVYTATTSSPWQGVNFQNDAGQFVWACNGSDTPVTYNGTSWSANSGLSGTDGTITLSIAALVGCMVHKKRIWAIEKNSLRAWFLPVQAISGAMQLLDMGAVFQKGGSLVACTTWTSDGGIGPDDYAVFITSKGEVAVWQGTDPTDANNWAIVGVYALGEPLGRRCFLQYGADVAVLTTIGVLPLSQALNLNRAEQEDIAFTDKIKNAFRTAQAAYGANFGWEGVIYPGGGLAIYNVPVSQFSTSVQYVQELETGKWSRFTGMNAFCWQTANGAIYFGSTDGVYQFDTGATDNGRAVYYDLQGAFSDHGMPGRQKRWTMIRPLLKTSAQIQPALDMEADYKSSVPTNVPTVEPLQISTWGSMTWGSMVWSDAATIRYDWTGVGAIGFVGAPRMTFQVQEPYGSLLLDGAGHHIGDGSGNELAVSGVNSTLPAQLLGFDVVFQLGGIL